MKAALLKQLGQPLSLEEYPLPAIASDEVLVQTRTCGICRTDLHLQDGLAYVPALPHVPGHEPAGTVAAVGAQVTEIAVGQRVVPHLFVTCGRCRYCRTGQEAQCAELGGIIGVTRAGGFAEYFAAPARNLLVLPEEVDYAAGGLVSCAAVTAVRAYHRARLELGQVAAVIGVGGIGQLLVQLLKAAGVRVAALSRSERALDLARQAGAGLALQLGDPHLLEQIRTFADDEGADCAFECVGTAATMKTAAALLRRGGRMVVIGEEPEFPQIDTIQIAQRELEIIGSRNGSRREAAEALALMATGILRPQLAARFPLDHLNDALDLVRRGQAHGRVIVDIS